LRSHPEGVGLVASSRGKGPQSNPQVLLQQFRPHLFLFFQLLTSYERPDDPEFLQFVERTEKILRVKLLPTNWRHVVLAESGKPLFRKVDWSGAAQK